MKKKQVSLMFFLIIQLYIYVMLISFNSLINTQILSFISSVLCLIMGIFLFCKTKDYYIMISALVFTALADIFLIFFNNLHNIGLIFLNIVQILYFLRIYVDTDYKKSNVLTRIISIPILCIIGFILLKEKTDVLAILWIIFISNLFINILFTIKEIGLNNFFPIGLLLLFMYGIMMMFMSLNNYLNINVNYLEKLNELSFDLKIMFNLPAQVVLTCSIFTVNRRCFSAINKEENKNRNS